MDHSCPYLFRKDFIENPILLRLLFQKILNNIKINTLGSTTSNKNTHTNKKGKQGFTRHLCLVNNVSTQ